MWTRVVGGFVFLVVISYAIQWLLPKEQRARRISSRRYVMWDIAPLLGFFGVLLLVLSGIQAAQGGNLVAWLGGAGIGILIGIFSWIALAQTAHPSPSRARPSVLRIALTIVRTYGLPIVIAFLVLNLAIRWLGAALETFITGGLGAVVVVSALALFSSERRKTTDNSPQR